MNFLTPIIASTSGLLLMFNSIGFVPLWSHCSGYKRHRITANNDITTNRQYCSRKQSFVVTPVGVEGLATLSEAPSQNMATFFDVWTVRLDKPSRQFLLKLKTLHNLANIPLMFADYNSLSPPSLLSKPPRLHPPPHIPPPSLLSQACWWFYLRLLFQHSVTCPQRQRPHACASTRWQAAI